MKTIFEHNRRVRFSDADLGGVLFFGRFFELAHETLEEALATSPLGWDYWFQNSEFLVPIKHTEGDYVRPVLPGKPLQVKLSVTQISEHSVAFQFEFSQESQLCAILNTVHVFVNKVTRKKLLVPRKVTEFLGEA